jgi:hypothetical protein
MGYHSNWLGGDDQTGEVWVGRKLRKLIDQGKVKGYDDLPSGVKLELQRRRERVPSDVMEHLEN